MKKVLTIAALFALLGTGLFAQSSGRAAGHALILPNHHAGDMNLGLQWNFGGLMMSRDPRTLVGDTMDSLDFDSKPTGGGELGGWLTSGPQSDGKYHATGTITAGVDVPRFFATARVFQIGVNFEYYVFNWMSVSTGLTIGPEVNMGVKSGKLNIDESIDKPVNYEPGATPTTIDKAKSDIMDSAVKKALDKVHIQAGLFLVVPVMVHFNIPRAQWFYPGVGLNVNIPLWDFGLDEVVRSAVGGDAGKSLLKAMPGGSVKGETFLSMPIDLGFDFSRDGRNGANPQRRLLLRIEPEFLGNGFYSCPISIVWQSRNWHLTTLTIPGTAKNVITY
jgi:hypothetical protein